MGLFDFLRKPPPQVTLPQICYDVAYFVLPHYAFKDFEKIVDLCTNTPAAAGPFFYLLACQFRKSAPNPEDGRKFQWHVGTLDSERHYFALEYPVPPPIELSSVPPEKLLSETAPLVLAPYFSAVIRRERTHESEYYVLGQAPLGGGTTLRCVEPDGKNCNLGPGPNPDLDAFLNAVKAIGKR